MVVGEPGVGGDLHPEGDAEVLEGVDHGAAEEALVEADRDVADARFAEPGHPFSEPRLGTGGGVGAAGPPAHAHAIARLLQEGQQGVVRGPARLLRIVPALGPRLTGAVADRDGGIEDQRDRVRHADLGPAPLDDLPEQRIEERHQRRRRAPQPPAEGRGVGDPHPAEQTPDAAVEQLEVVERRAAVKEQHHPDLHHETRAEEARQLLRVMVDPASELQAVPQLAQQDQAAAVGQVTGAMTQAQRRRVALQMRSRGYTMVSHRPGVLRGKDSRGCKSLQHKALGGVLHPHTTAPLQDPG